jgi:acyl-CoA synthetase (AMP-forming)/AMP-acid ligase II/alkylation response protein AidB-like acyl-CoA dehydrogenase/acyl carrier protein
MILPNKKEFFSIIPQEAVTLLDVLQLQAQKQPNSIGFNFLETNTSLTYGELDRQAQAIAAHLQSLYRTQERILLMYPPGLELIAGIMGCIYAGIIPVPVYPPRRNRNLERLNAISEDASSSAILTTVALEKSLQEEKLQEENSLALPIIATDGISLDLASAWQFPSINSDNIALLQYTSGSTGNPKGVMVSHGNLLHNLKQIYQRFGHSSASRGLIWLPPYHDMGLMGGIFQPLYGGFPVTLMTPVTFLQKPIRWLQLISQTRATTSGGPNFAYEMCLGIRAEDCQDLDLSCWELAFTGAEPIRIETLDKFTEKFAPYGFRREAFYPCYGLAEGTLFVTGKNNTINNAIKIENYQGKSIVSCGVASGQQSVIVVNTESRQPCAEGEEGEIWVSGKSIAQGYWHRPQETEETFKAVLASGEGEFLRTGDLGILRGGELFVTGRIKDMIVIRGCNYYPQDIEVTISQSHDMLSPHWGAAFSVEIAGQEKLVIVQEVERSAWRSLDTMGIINAIRSAVSREFELQVYAICLLKPGSIPKTSSGKVQRRACRMGFVGGSLDVVYEWQLPSELNHEGAKEAKEEGVKERKEAKEEGVKERKEEGEVCLRVDKIIDWLRDYAGNNINSLLMDERRSISPHIVLDFGNQGLLGMQVPSSYGGLGLGNTDFIRIIQQLGAIDPTLALFVGLNNVLGIRPILMYGQSSLQEELLPLLATGRELAAFALTEPGAGSNPQAIVSQAISDDNGGWRLRGEKIWSGSAAWSGVINIFVRHQQGISGFAVRRGTKGLIQGKEALTMGMRGMVQNTIYLQDIPVTDEQLLGEAGSGMNVAQDAMMYGRLAIAAACVGGMKRCVQLMWRYSSRRQVATGRLVEHPVVLHNFNELMNAITAVETLVIRIAGLLDKGVVVPVEAYTACKISAPEFYWQAADLLVQTLGGRGYIETNLAPQILRDARILRIFEGPTETLCGFLGARVFKQTEAIFSLLCQTLGAVEVAQKLTDAVEQIREITIRNGDDLLTQRWAYHQVGQLATDAILLAALVGNENQNVNQSLNTRQAISWIENRFNEKLNQILVSLLNKLTFVKTESINTRIREYIQTIGDIEQTLAGEDYQLDNLLRKSSDVNEKSFFIEKTSVISTDTTSTNTTSTNTTSTNINPANIILSNIQTNQDKKLKEIQTWLINWLSKKLHIPTSGINSNKAFADYGMDSVTAVELAQDLQEWLDISQPLEPTIAWNFPTIEDLAQYLNEINQNTLPLSPTPHSPLPTPHSPNLDELSAAEMAVLLAQEIAIANQRNQRNQRNQKNQP